LNTGDFAKIDASGNIIICGLDKDLIYHKGINNYPPEILNFIMMHTSVVAVGIIDVDDDDSGQISIAYVQVHALYKELEAELRAFCNQHLTNYKISCRFIIMQEL